MRFRRGASASRGASAATGAPVIAGTCPVRRARTSRGASSSRRWLRHLLCRHWRPRRHPFRGTRFSFLFLTNRAGISLTILAPAGARAPLAAPPSLPAGAPPLPAGAPPFLPFVAATSTPAASLWTGASLAAILFTAACAAATTTVLPLLGTAAALRLSLPHATAPASLVASISTATVLAHDSPGHAPVPQGCFSAVQAANARRE